MELKELLTLLRRWSWLLILGLLAGLLGGYLASTYMEPVYEASSKLMISREIQEENPDFSGLNSQQLVQTYVQILKTKPLLDKTSELVGFDVDPEQVSVQQILDTQIIEIKTEDHNPENAEKIANTLVLVLIEQNEEMQTGQYSTLESRLAKQLEQVEGQIDDLQLEYDQVFEKDYQDQLALVEEQLETTQSELNTLQIEMATLRPEWKPDDKILMAEKQARVDQLQAVFRIYEEIRANLLVLGRPVQYNNAEVSPRLQQVQSTLNLYQELYLTLVGDLEKVRLARMQQTPNVFQIEQAVIPEKPVRPIPLLYTSISGMVGLMLAIGLAFFVEALKDDQKPNSLTSQNSNQWQLEPPDVAVKEKANRDIHQERSVSNEKKENPARKALLAEKKV